MTDGTNDINELEALLGHTKAAYSKLEHEGVLSAGARRRFNSVRYASFAIAASLTVAVALFALTIMNGGGPGMIPPSRLATSLPTLAAPAAPTASVGSHVFTRARQFPASFSMPSRPAASNG